MKYTAQELFDMLNQTDESAWLEAKGVGDSTVSIMETVCAYSNEPGLGGGYILMSISADDAADEPFQYKVDPLPNPDKLQSDLATQCASMFNLPVRPKIILEKINGLNAVKIWVDELPDKQKPLYFKKDKLPNGALRRIGSTDQHCTDDDMHVFYQEAGSYDQTPVKGAWITDVDENALKRYRVLRENVNPAAEELTFDDRELLEALGCVNKENPTELNVAGLLLFGSSKLQRSNFPMLRVDYIRVPGNTWVENPDNRFTTIDMRGPLIIMLYRLIDAINADLPKGFLLPEDEVQAVPMGLPIKALREAIVNAMMHRSYREHRPTQIIRYDNRIEIINPGFSLKSEEKLGMPGSETRNPFIAAVFHETNLAETKGSGIKAMRKLMQAAHLAPPTFESNRGHNEFTSRLLLHHFLDTTDLEFLKRFEKFGLIDSQKQAIIFTREVGAIDNATYRQMAECDTLKASSDLRSLKQQGLLTSKGKGKAAYYVAGSMFTSLLSAHADTLSAHGDALSTHGDALSTHGDALSTHGDALSTHGDALSAHGDLHSAQGETDLRANLFKELPHLLRLKIAGIKPRENKPEVLNGIVKELCGLRAYKLSELAILLGKREDYLRRKFLLPLIKNKEMRYLYPEMIKHPSQAYRTIEKS